MAFSPSIAAQDPALDAAPDPALDPALQTTLEQHVSGAVAVLAQLDTLASSCLTALQQDQDAAAGTPCTEFLAAIDGDTLAAYLAHCAVLTEWKTQYVSTAFREAQNSAAAAAQLQLLVGVEYACADDALQQRTQFVIAAFAELQPGAKAIQRDLARSDRSLRELQLNATLSAERRLLLDSVQQQQLQRERESERQMRQLELELLRQQRNQ